MDEFLEVPDINALVRARDPHQRAMFYRRWPELREKRAEMILAWRVNGAPLKQIAEALGIHPSTVSTELRWAKEQSLWQKGRERLFDLIGHAINCYEEALVDKDSPRGDVEIATKVLEGLGLLGRYAQVHVNTPPPIGGKETFESWRMKVTKETREYNHAKIVETDDTKGHEADFSEIFEGSFTGDGGGADSQYEGEKEPGQTNCQTVVGSLPEGGGGTSDCSQYERPIAGMERWEDEGGTIGTGFEVG